MKTTSMALSYFGLAMASITSGSLSFSFWNKPVAFVLWFISVIMFIPAIRIISTGSENCLKFNELPPEHEYIFVRKFLGVAEIDYQTLFGFQRAIVFNFPKKLRSGTKFNITTERKIKITIIEIQATQSA